MSMITCGEATMRLLADYGVDTVFGIPGVHTLDFCRGLGEGPIHHVQARNEQGAGFMADGYARTTGKPGVALVISGPGVTNALTAVGQSYADSIPVLLLSSETDSSTHGKGWGALHEIPDQRAVTDPLTAMSLRANTPDDVPEFVAQAFGVFAGQRPRPVHISVPVDVLALPVEEGAWTVRALPGRAQPHAHDVAAAVTMIALAERPLVMVGGGAVEAAEPIRSLVDALNAPVVASNSGKGIVPDDHPLSLTASTVRPEVQRLIGKADLVVAIGTELAETDSFVDELPINGELLRIDIDPLKINDHYPADLGIVADASATVAAIVSSGDFASNARNRGDVEAELQGIRIEVETNMTDSERRHSRLLAALLHGLPENTVYMGDICQLVYTGAYAFPVREPRRWSYPAGFCTLGCGLPNAIGAALAMPDTPIVCLVGDGGVMFTVQELIVAAEEGLGIPVIIWDNNGLKQIQDDMLARDVPLVGVTGRNPDFVGLSEALGCDAVIACSLDHVVAEANAGFGKDHPTVIIVRESEDWLVADRTTPSENVTT